MGHIIIAYTGIKSLANSVNALAYQLLGAGNHVSIAAFEDLDAKIPAGSSYLQLPKVDYFISASLTDYVFAGRSGRLRQSVELLRYEAVKSIISRSNPDLIIIDNELHEVIIATEELKLKYLIFTPWAYSEPFSRIPHLSSNVIPGRGVAGNQLVVKCAWFAQMLKLQLHTIRGLLKGKVNRRFLLSHLIKAYAPDLRVVPNEFPPVFLYTNRTIWSFTMREFDFPHQNSEHFKYAGPILSDFSLVANRPGLLSEIIERQKEGNKLIYMSVSSFGTADLSVLERCIEAFKNKKDWILIISKAGQDIEIQGISKYANVFALDWVDQMQTLEHFDCVINHGGINTINECIYHQVPMLVLSGERFDQNGCAARVAYHGLGISAKKDLITSEQIKNHIEYLLAGNCNGQLQKFREVYNKKYNREDSEFKQEIYKRLQKAKPD